MAGPILSIKDLQVYYGSSHVVRGASLTLDSGLITLIGRNGMGKTTLAGAIMGLAPVKGGDISLLGESIVGKPPYKVAAAGIGYVPQGRRVFPSLTVDEHLRFAARPKGKQNDWTAERVYELFPRLKERRHQSGTSLSGGEQQMLAIGRALVLNPILLIMDEPSEGLAPVIVEQLIEVCRNLLSNGMSIFLIEQNLGFVSAMAAETHVMVSGQIAYKGPVSRLIDDSELARRYLGVGMAEV